MRREYVVSSVGLSPDGIELNYMVLPEDVRSGGEVVSARSVSIAFTSPAGLGAAATDLRTSVEGLVALLESSMANLPVYEPPAQERLSFPDMPADDDDDEDIGMGDGR